MAPYHRYNTTDVRTSLLESSWGLDLDENPERGSKTIIDDRSSTLSAQELRRRWDYHNTNHKIQIPITVSRTVNTNLIPVPLTGVTATTKGTRSPRQTKVRFEDKRNVIHIIKYPVDDAGMMQNDTWYRRDEYILMRQRDYLILQLKESNQFRECDTHTFRGLEKHGRSKNALQAVFFEQARQRNEGIYNPELIATMYILEQDDVRKAARQLAIRDAHEVSALRMPVGQASKSRSLVSCRSVSLTALDQLASTEMPISTFRNLSPVKKMKKMFRSMSSRNMPDEDITLADNKLLPPPLNLGDNPVPTPVVAALGSPRCSVTTAVASKATEKVVISLPLSPTKSKTHRRKVLLDPTACQPFQKPSKLIEIHDCSQLDKHLPIESSIPSLDVCSRINL